MRHRPELILLAAVSAFALTGWIAFAIDARNDVVIDPAVLIEPPLPPADAAAWFGQVRQYCNSVEVETRMRLEPPPPTPEGAMHEAACYALAGRIDRSRELIVTLAEGQRYMAAGVVFEAGHPAADAGDDVAAGPLMELVVEFWPNHYMALYHAGAARYEQGHYVVAVGYLERFMAEYDTEDGWRTNARAMLASIAEERYR